MSTIELPILSATIPGGAKHPTEDELLAMQTSPYVLRAHGGELTRISAEKTLLQHDPQGNDQSFRLMQGPNGVLYVYHASVLSKSVDEGRTWTTVGPDLDMEKGAGWSYAVLGDGKLVRVWATSGLEQFGPAEVSVSDDEGQTWKVICEFPIDVPGFTPRERYVIFPVTRLRDGTLLWTIYLRDDVCNQPGQCFGPDGTHSYDEGWVSGKGIMVMYRSTDDGKHWERPSIVHDVLSEGGIAELESGKLVMAARYQRPLLPSDPPDFLDTIHHKRGVKNEWLFKHVALMESNDAGQTWQNLRVLTGNFGQCYGYPTALSGDGVMVIHDTRYGPGVASGRALISRDAGRTWEDETYYLFYGEVKTGYSQSIQLKDGVVLTIGATVSSPPEARYNFHAGIGHADVWAIRWKPVKD